MTDNWLERTELLLGAEKLEKLRAAHVLVVGLGGVGAYAAEMIVRAGVGRMTVADADTVNPTNINRQLVALHSTVGRPKAEVLAERLRDINPTLELHVVDKYIKDEETDLLLDSARFDYAVDAIDTLSPKLALILGPWRGTELYLNYGHGFHSNDARGTTIRVDPANPGASAARVDPLVRTRGRELGLRGTPLPGWQSTLTLWQLEAASELLFVGDAGTTEPSRPSRRHGLEWTNLYTPTDWLAVDADLSGSHARFTDRAPEGRHIPGAVNLRETFTYLATSTPQGLQELKDTFAAHLGAIGLSGAETAVFYEDALNSGYGQSCRGYYLLTWLGYPKVKVLNGGYSAWKAAELPVSTEAVVPTPAIFPTNLATTDVMLTKEDVIEALGTDTVLLDVRDVDEWIGDSSSPYGKDFAPRKGRLPGAKWLEWYRFMKPSPQGPVFKSPDEVRAECATAGISPADTVYLYCFKGARASNTFLALKQAGFADVRMYFGSWNEWSRDDKLPIESGLPLVKFPKKPALALAA